MPLRYLFIPSLFIFPLLITNKDIIKQCLLGMLFFLVFTTGIAVQYFILPIALGTLRPSKGFSFYTFAATLFILGHYDDLFIPILHMFAWNIVWLTAIAWFIAEMYNAKKLWIITAETVKS